MTKPLFAGLLSATLAITSLMATPGRADDRDVARTIAAIAAIALIGSAIHNRNERRTRQPSTSLLEPLPAACVFEFWGNRGPEHALSARCAGQEMRHADHLPASCQIRVSVERGRNDRNEGRARDAYDIACLTRAGYRFDR